MKKNKILITHDGTFHADDVFAAATLSLLLEKRKEKFKIIRTRDKKIIAKGDYVFDVGGVYNQKKNLFDHHQISFKDKRKNKIMYSSFGLVWKKFGENITGNKKIAHYIDLMLVEQIDAIDNGVSIFKPLSSHIVNYDISSVVSSFLPVWGEKDSFSSFNNAVKFAKHILQKEIKQFSALHKVKELIEKAYKNSKNKKLLIINKKIPRYLVDTVTRDYKPILYLVFPAQEQNWKVLAVRKAAGSFESKKKLPKTWAGLNYKDLQKITGVSDAVFCHKALFTAVAKSKEGAIALAQKALAS